MTRYSAPWNVIFVNGVSVMSWGIIGSRVLAWRNLKHAEQHGTDSWGLANTWYNAPLPWIFSYQDDLHVSTEASRFSMQWSKWYVPLPIGGPHSPWFHHECSSMDIILMEFPFKIPATLSWLFVLDSVVRSPLLSTSWFGLIYQH